MTLSLRQSRRASSSSTVWGPRRIAILAAVIALHTLCIALLMLPRSELKLSALPSSVEITFLPAAPPPKIIPQNSLPHHLSGLSAITVVPPVPESLAIPPTDAVSDGPKSVSNGHGPGVNWSAEARRAIQAFEIRSRQPSNGISLAGSPAEEHWWTRSPHHAGEQFKTADGDWIVWINSDCYQIAVAGSDTHMFGQIPARTICAADSKSN